MWCYCVSVGPAAGSGGAWPSMAPTIPSRLKKIVAQQALDIDALKDLLGKGL